MGVFEHIEGVFLQRIISGDTATWTNASGASATAVLKFEHVRSLEFGSADAPVVARHGHLNAGTHETLTLAAANERPEDFKRLLNTVSHLDTRRLREMVALLKRRQATGDANLYALALARRAADIAAPFVMTLISIPLAFAFGKRGTLVALTVAVMVGLGFWGAVSGFNQLGLYQIAPPLLAAWAAPVIFAAVGAYLFARVRT